MDPSLANLNFNHGTLSAEKELGCVLQEAISAVSKHQLGQQALSRKNKAKAQLLDILSGKTVCSNEDDRAKALSFAESMLRKASCTLVNLGTIQYFRPMTSIFQYCKICKQYLLSESDESRYQTLLKVALLNLENLLDHLQGSRNGSKTGTSIQRSELQSFDAILRIEQHLQDRLENMTANRSKVVEQITQLSIVQQALNKARTLPSDSFILFFENGMLLQKKGHDERFYTQTFDVDRLCNNDGRLDRLIGHNPDGFVVIRAMLDANGVPMISKTAGRLLKEVIDFEGAVPDNVSRGMDLGLLLRKYKQRYDPSVKIEHKDEVQAVVK